MNDCISLKLGCLLVVSIDAIFSSLFIIVSLKGTVMFFQERIDFKKKVLNFQGKCSLKNSKNFQRTMLKCKKTQKNFFIEIITDVIRIERVHF